MPLKPVNHQKYPKKSAHVKPKSARVEAPPAARQEVGDGAAEAPGVRAPPGGVQDERRDVAAQVEIESKVEIVSSHFSQFQL